MIADRRNTPLRLCGVILSLLACCSFLAVGCGRTPPKTITPTGEIISLSDSILRSGGADTIHFGRMHSGEIAVKSLRLRNDSQRPVAVISYTRTCGCTIFDFDTQPITSGSEAAASLTFDSGGLTGWQFKLIEVQFANAAAPLKIYVNAEVE